ncbi:MAG: winged helix-turn-helix domain-containing protein [Candidatus Aenigmatarchaeota archaeon]
MDVVKLLPPALPSGKKILWKQVDPERIEVYVDKNSARGGNAEPIVIKRFIEINELLFEGLGLRFGDGIKLQAGLPKVYGFSNTNLELIKYFLKFTKESFGIEPKEFRVAITMPPSLSSKLEEIESNISRELSIPRKNFYKTRILERRNKPIIDIKINSTLLGLILNLLFDNLQPLLFSNELFCAGILRGIIASEANVSLLPVQNKLREITIAGKEKSKRDFIRQLLFKLKIIPDKDKEIPGQECVLITGLSNFKLIEKWNLCVLQPEKQNDFKKGISNFKVVQSRKGELRLKVLQLLSEKPRTRQELGKLLNRSPDTVKTEALYILEKQGLVERGEITSKTRLWKITEKGLNLLKGENVLEKLRSKSPTLP